MSWHTPPDIPAASHLVNLGAWAADQGYTQPSQFRSLMLTNTGAGTVRVGDEFTSAVRGMPLLASSTVPGMLIFPWVGEAGLNPLGSVYVYVPVGCAVSIAWED